MKQKKKIFYIILIFTTLTGMWIFPSLVKKITYKPDSYPFVYYSCMLEELCLVEYSNKKNPMTDLKGNIYTTAQFDSLMPMLNYRQLMSDGRLPDSLKGVEINPKILRAKAVTYKYNPKESKTPDLGLHILFEAMPKRVGLEMPDDVFRIQDKIEFIDTESNTVNIEKSEKFQKALEKEGYTFPTTWASGNPNPRKPYDEGYFCLDANGELFHLKMVNDRPYIKNTHISDSIDIASFAMLEAADKRFYGFLFGKAGDMYIVENEGGNYQTVKLDIDPIDMSKDQIILMGNMFDWTVSIVTPSMKKSYGMDATTLKRMGEHKIERVPGKWDKVSEWLFPAYLTIEDKNSNYLSPAIHFTAITAFIINLLLAIGIALFVKNTPKKRIFNFVYVLITGIAGFVALLILPNLKKKY